MLRSESFTASYQEALVDLKRSWLMLPADQIEADRMIMLLLTSCCARTDDWFSEKAVWTAQLISCDDRRTWRKTADNPILSQESEDVHITKWRDPYVCVWELMVLLRDRDSPLWYHCGQHTRRRFKTIYICCFASQIDSMRISWTTTVQYFTTSLSRDRAQRRELCAKSMNHADMVWYHCSIHSKKRE